MSVAVFAAKFAPLPRLGNGAMLDDLNRRILKEAAKHEKVAASISEIVKPFLNEKSDRALRERINDLANQGLFELEKHPGCVLVRVTKEGYVEAQAAQGGEPHGL
jgi:hypothetical protein